MKMDRGKSLQGKRPVKVKGSLPPGDLFALGSKPTKPDTSFQKSSGSSGSLLGDKKLSALGDRKREASSLLNSSSIGKKPKLLGSGQTFTPLGRPVDREAEKRLSPIPPTSYAFEDSAIEVDSTVILSEILSAEESNDIDRLEGLLCGAVKYLHSNRSKPDQILYLSLMHLAKSKPSIFNSETVIEAFCTLLKRDMSLNFKSKGNSLVSVLACNVLMKAYNDEDNWPDDFVKVYIEDALGERVWVDRSDCKGFVDNIVTAFNTNMPKGGISAFEMKIEQGSASPAVSIGEDEDIKMEIDSDSRSSASQQEVQNVTVYPRYPYQIDNIETFVMEIIHEQLIKRQLMDASAKMLIKLMTATCGYSEVRLLGAQKLELWLQNPKLARASQELLMSVCMNCSQHDAEDMEVIALLIKMRMKTKPLINHYLACIRELLGQHPENLRMVLTHTIYNELSTTRNPNNMSLIGVVFTTKPEVAAKILAEIFQDLLTNKDDYLRALRTLFREIVRSLRYEINFAAFCLALMQERTEPKFTDMEPAFKERYLMSVVDLVCMCVLQAITPAVREAVTAISRGDKKDIDVLRNYQNLVATIQRDSVWWLHTVVPKMFEPKGQDFVFCMRKLLFMENAEHYVKDNWPAEAERGSMLRLATECPVLEDTLMRVLVLGLSREVAMTPNDAVEFADILVKRAANISDPGLEVLLVERLELFDALLNLCTYRHPENIALPPGYTPPQLAISALYWKAWSILLIIAAYNPTTYGLAAWENYPTLKCMIEMVMTNNYKFPPPTTAVDDAVIEEIRTREIQVAQKEKHEILEFEGHLAASTSKVTITEANSLLIAQLTSMDPNGAARKPPQTVMDQLRSLNDSLKIGQMLCRSRNPDFLLDIIQRQGTSQSMPWLAELVESSEGSLDVLPVQCLCEFLLQETQDVVREGQDDDTVKFEKHKKKQKIRKQQQLLSRLQTLVHDSNTDSSTTQEVMDYFLKRLASTQAANRVLATKGMSMIISRSQLSPTDEDVTMVTNRNTQPHNWLLVNLPALPMFPQVKHKTCTALRQAIQIEADPSLVSAYIMFLSQYTSDLTLQELDELALDVAQLIVERTTIINYILPLDSQSSSKDMRDRTLEAFLQLYVTYVKKAREPNTAGYSWSNTQDQIILQWEGGESATMHILVVHAMIILLSFGPAHNEALYKELKETWFPEKGKPPSAFLLDTSEEALLLPDWLKLRMIRSSAEPLIDAALQDLEPSQLLLFVQSFGIPVHSMSKLLQCLDNAATMDMASLEQSVLDKAYMAQLIEVQHKRGARGGDKFYSMLTDGRKLEIHKDDEEMEVESAEDSVWKFPRPTEIHVETIPASHVVNMILQAFDPSGRKSPDTETHFRALLMTVDRRNSGALDIIKGLNEILRGSTGGDFTKSIMHSVKACSLLRRIIAKQDEAGVKASLLETMEVLSKHCMGQKSLMSSMVHQCMLSQSKHKPQKPQLRTAEHQLYVEDLKKAELADTSELEIMVRESMKSAVARGGVAAATHLACSVLHCTKDSGLLPSTCALFVDWLELLDPEVIRLVPDLQEKLLFAKQAESQSTLGREHSSQPYLLALLTHQSSWKILHRCINSLLTSSDKGYDPVTVLDFLWACIHIPKIWQGREKRMPKNQSVEDVLCLTGSQLIVLANYIIQEATSLSYNEPGTTKQSPVTIRNRIELLKACISGEPENVRELVLYIEKMMQIKSEKKAFIIDSESTRFYEACLLELYLNYPYLLAWLSDIRCVTSEASVLPNSETQMDLITHRLITGLYQGSKSKDNSNKMSDVNTACRKLAAEHPVLLLRQLPAIVALLKGKTQFTFAEFKQRNLLMLYTYILGILELLQPNIFSKEHPALNHILEEYFNLLTAYSGHSHKQMGPLIVKLVQLLNQYVSYDSQRANSLLQKHVLLLTSVSSQFPDLSPLKSLLAGLTLPRHSHEDVGTPSGEPAGGSVYPVRPPSPWAASHLGPFIQKIKKDNSEEVLMVLQDLDESSKRKIDILEHFVDDFKRLLLAHNDQCRNTAFELVKRYIRQNPRQGVDFVPAFLHCLENDDPNVVMSALTNLAEFTMLCQDHADVILQKALSTGINTSVETSSYISESLQLLNLDLASG